MQETTISARFEPGMRFLVFDFGLNRGRAMRVCAYAYPRIRVPMPRRPTRIAIALRAPARRYTRISTANVHNVNHVHVQT
eukprot:2860588-Rhodomonas_salina.1